jgi:hypothetical protein
MLFPIRLYSAARAVALALAVPLLVSAAGCSVEGGAAYPGYDGDYPSDAYVATTTPAYYGGHANYWYGNRWNYRSGGTWNHYDREPGALAQQRAQGAPQRRTYERPTGNHYRR